MVHGKKNRVIASLSGFGIILVVLGHSEGVTKKLSLEISSTHPSYHFFCNQLIGWIYTFHMPLFFAISGFLYCYSTLEKGNVDLGRLALSKFKRLIIPYLMISSVSFPVKALFSIFAARPVELRIDLYIDSLIVPWDNTIELFWFLPTLFIVFMIGAFLLRNYRAFFFDLGAIVVSLGLWWLFPNRRNHSFLNIQGVCHYFIFFAMGFFVSKYHLYRMFDIRYKVKQSYLIGVASIIISLCLFIFWPQGRVSGLLMAASGIVLSAWLCYQIPSNKLYFLGNYSYQIYLFSWFPQVFIRIIFGQIFFINIWLSVCLSFFLGLLLPIVVTQILNTLLNPKFRILYGVSNNAG